MGNAVAVMRVSSERQGFDGDSIEHQKDQIDLFASNRNIIIKKYFVFIESASKEQQPIQEAIDYCANPKNNIQLFIIKSIDRFTRGGAFFYEHMKSELTKHEVQLVDLYGVINNQEINTLEHLGVKYSWSVYTPSKKSELLEAERGKDELRDIMSRMIGSEIRYTRLGYRVRAAPFGYQNKQTETVHGKRFILKPHPKEALWIKRMYELKAQSIYSDKEIVRQINMMGFRSRRKYLRDPKNTTRAIGVIGEKELSLKYFDRLLRNPIYAGITVEKWTQNRPIKCQFKGLVSLEMFNQANTGKVMIFEENGELKILKDKVLKKRMVETKISILYPYRKLIVCGDGKHPFYGSASRGRRGNYFPAYHCDKRKRGHYRRIPVKKFHDTVVDYLRSVRIKRDYIETFHANISHGQQIKLYDSQLQKNSIKERLLQIDREISLLVLKIKMLHSEAALLAIESDIEKLKSEKERLITRKSEVTTRDKNDKNIYNESRNTKLNRIPEDIITDHNIVMKKQLFELLFLESPCYDDLVNRTALLKPEFEI